MTASKFDPLMTALGDADCRDGNFSYDQIRKVVDEDRATSLKLLRQALDALKGVGEVEVPERGHTGSCGPEAGCDGLCTAAAYASERNYKVKRAVRALEKHFGES